MAAKSGKKVPTRKPAKPLFNLRLRPEQLADVKDAAELETERLHETVPAGTLFRECAMNGPSIYEILRRHGRTPKSQPVELAEEVA
jgi:hypothetical protein